MTDNSTNSEAGLPPGSSIDPLPLVNQGAINRLRGVEGVSGQPLLPELVELYLQETREFLARMAVSLDAGDRRQVKKLAHSLKGSSRNLGLERMADMALTLELGAEGLSHAAVGTLIGELRVVFERTLPVLADYRTPDTD